MTAYQYIKDHVNTKLAPSPLHGVGIFAMRTLEIGEKLFVNWTGNSGNYYLSEQEVNSLDYDVKMHLFDMYEYTKVDGKWVFSLFLENNCHWIFKSPMHWVNSCSWNSEPNFDRNSLTVTQTIYKGSELLTKYGRYEKFRDYNII